MPDELQLGWMPIFNLGYLVFLFLPLIFAGRGDSVAQAWYPARTGPAVADAAVGGGVPAVVLRRATAPAAPRLIACMLGIAALGYALLPFNPFANTYLVYAAGFAAFIGRALWRRSAWLALILAVFLAEILLLRYPVFVFALTTDHRGRGVLR